LREQRPAGLGADAGAATGHYGVLLGRHQLSDGNARCTAPDLLMCNPISTP
jgi:hypothetical protein